MLRCAGGELHEPFDDVGRRREEEHAADDPVHGLQPVPEPRDDAEVASPAPDRPEQIRVRLGIDGDELAIGRHHIRSQQGVDREPVLANEEADPSAERDAADPNGARVAEAGRESLGSGGRRVLGRREPGSCLGCPSAGIDVEHVQVAYIQDDATVVVIAVQ